MIEENADVKHAEVILEKEDILLNAVTITGKRSPFKLEAGTTTVNVSSVALGSDGSILNVLSKNTWSIDPA